MKILNLYAGIGGNRLLWDDADDVTAVEYDESIAKCYAHNFPKDELHIGDAHEYLLNNYDKFDFIWASPPCPTHSHARFIRHTTTTREYPDMRLYQEIIYLKHHFKGKWIIENVNPYYTPLIPPTKKLGRHLIWANFPISTILVSADKTQEITIEQFKKNIPIDIDGFEFNQRKDKVLRNCVKPEIGSHILDCAKNIIKKEDVNQLDIFESLNTWYNDIT